MVKWTLKLSGILCAIGLCSPIASADIGVIQFEGLVTSVKGDLPSDIIPNQTQFWGTITMETDSHDRKSNPLIGVYRSAIVSSELHIGTYSISDSVFHRTLIRDDADQMTVSGRPMASAFGGRTIKKSKLKMVDSSQTAFTGDTLSQLLPMNLDAFDQYNGATLLLRGQGLLSNSRFNLKGTILTMTIMPIPAPGAMVLGLMGIGLVASYRKKYA